MDAPEIVPDARSPLRAAAYIRMSSAAQALSPQLQEAYLRRYADAHAMRIVRVYADEGRSGLVLAGRGGLQQLLADVAAGNTDFSILLVYDVSRWGRYQDGDEAGFYEFLCRKAGIRLLYCAENFINDGAPMSQLLKSIKRSMAAEYSRELSAKVSAGQRRLALLGFKQGGAATYGMRRVAVSADGGEARLLAPGERKPRPTDRVLLAPGDARQVAVVRRIFNLYTRDGHTLTAIARRLNAERVPSGGAEWTRHRVLSVLTQEHYWGNLVYNRRSSRLKTPQVSNTPEQWVRKVGALEAIVPAAAGALAGSVRRMRNGEDPEAVLAAIRAIYARHGTVTLKLLLDVPGMPAAGRLARMFGSLAGAYQRAGLVGLRHVDHAVPQTTLAAMARQLRDQVAAKAAAAGGQAEYIAGAGNRLRLNGRLTLRVTVVTCHRKAEERRFWRVVVHGGLVVDFILAGLLDRDNRLIERYALVTAAGQSRHTLDFGRGHLSPSTSLLHPSLDAVFGLPPTGQPGGR